MSNNLINLALRFFLEIAALVAAGYWGWTQHEGIGRVLLTIGIPLIMAALWGVFRVNDDPGKAPVVVSGWVRLLLEIAFFATASILLYAAQQQNAAILFAVVVFIHYVISYDRIVWLLRER